MKNTEKEIIKTCIKTIDSIRTNVKLLEQEGFKLLADDDNYEDQSRSLHLRLKCLLKDLQTSESILTNSVVRDFISDTSNSDVIVTPNMLQRLISCFRRKAV